MTSRQLICIGDRRGIQNFQHHSLALRLDGGFVLFQSQAVIVGITGFLRGLYDVKSSQGEIFFRTEPGPLPSLYSANQPVCSWALSALPLLTTSYQRSIAFRSRLPRLSNATTAVIPFTLTRAF